MYKTGYFSAIFAGAFFAASALTLIDYVAYTFGFDKDSHSENYKISLIFWVFFFSINFFWLWRLSINELTVRPK